MSDVYPGAPVAVSHRRASGSRWACRSSARATIRTAPVGANDRTLDTRGLVRREPPAV